MLSNLSEINIRVILKVFFYMSFQEYEKMAKAKMLDSQMEEEEGFNVLEVEEDYL